MKIEMSKFFGIIKKGNFISFHLQTPNPKEFFFLVKREVGALFGCQENEFQATFLIF